MFKQFLGVKHGSGKVAHDDAETTTGLGARCHCPVCEPWQLSAWHKTTVHRDPIRVQWWDIRAMTRQATHPWTALLLSCTGHSCFILEFPCFYSVMSIVASLAFTSYLDLINNLTNFLPHIFKWTLSKHLALISNFSTQEKLDGNRLPCNNICIVYT